MAKKFISLDRLATFLDQVKALIPTVNNPTITIKQAGSQKGTFSLNQSGNTTIELTDSNTTYSAATTSANGLMSSSDKTKLDGIATGATKVTVDSALSSSSTNPVQNKVINTALAGKAATSHTHDYLPLSGGTITGDIAFSGALSGKKFDDISSSKIIILPRVSYKIIDPTGTNTIYFKELLKWICENYPSTIHATFIGTVTPSSVGNVLIHIYDTSNVDADGYPQYSSGFYETYRGKIYTFGTTQYIFYYKEALFSDEAAYVKGISISGKTVTITKGDGTTSTQTTQDTTYSAATTSANGLMSSSDKTKLDGIATGANNYSLPTATSSVLGGVKTGSNITNSSGTISLTKANVTDALGYTPSATDTTYSTGTASASGLTKLYTSTGQATDGTMTQAAITAALTCMSITTHAYWHNSFTSGVKTFYYEGQDTTAYEIPVKYCFVFVARVNKRRGAALAIQWNGGTSGTTNMWINRLHDDTDAEQWAGWTQVADVLGDVESLLAEI